MPQAHVVGVEKPWIDAGLDSATKQLALRAARQLRPRMFGTLNKRIALAYVQTEVSEIATQLTVAAQPAGVKMTVTPIPFYDPEGKRLRG